MNIIYFFIAVQIILFFLMTFHDWIHLPPLTDIRTLEKYSSFEGRLINSFIFALMILIPLVLTWIYKLRFPFWVIITIVIFYAVLTLGTIASWWIPYFFGSSDMHKEGYQEYKKTHHFLPRRGDNIVPNTFHVILHFHIWTSLIISLCLLMGY